MAEEIVLFSRHSPRVRTMQTAENFLAGFREELQLSKTRFSFVKGKKVGATGLRERRALEALPEASASIGKRTFPKEQAEREVLADIEFARVDRGEPSEYLLSKEEILAPNRIGLLLTRSRLFGRLASRLGKRALGAVSPSLAREVPTVISIFMRHSKNKGDQLTAEGEALAKRQGRNVARFLSEYFRLTRRDSYADKKISPTVVLYVSHGGSPAAKGQLDWVLEHREVLGRPVDELGGKLSHAEGLITLGYADGRVKRLILRQHGITHLH